MAATYTNTLPTDRDKVRFFVQDTDVDPASNALFTDEEIDAMLTLASETGAAKPYCVASRLLGQLLTRFAVRPAAGRGVRMKQVSRLKVQYGIDGDARMVLECAIRELRGRCQWLSQPRPKVFQAL